MAGEQSPANASVPTDLGGNNSPLWKLVTAQRQPYSKVAELDQVGDGALFGTLRQLGVLA